jgi:hypothetical protein
VSPAWGATGMLSDAATDGCGCCRRPTASYQMCRAAPYVCVLMRDCLYIQYILNQCNILYSQYDMAREQNMVCNFCMCR